MRNFLRLFSSFWMSSVFVIGMLSFTGTAYAIAPFSASFSTLLSSASLVNADGVSTATITATIKNSSNFALTGCTVTLTSSRGASDTISAPSGVSTASGIVTWTVRSSTLGTSTFTARSGASATCGSNTAITQTAAVTFGSPSFSAANSTLLSSTPGVSADGVSTATITATIIDTFNAPVGGCTVTLSSTRSTTDTISAPSGVSNGSGIVTWTVKSSTIGNPIFYANSGTSALCGSPSLINQAISFIFFGPVTAAQSTVSASPASVTANGSTTSTITVTLRDVNSYLVSGKTVTLSSSRGATDTISAASGVSSASGVVTFTVKSSTAGSATFTAIDSTDSVTVTQTAGVTFTAGAVTAAQSTVSASPASVTADGSTASTITVTLKDVTSNVVAGKTVTLSSSRGATDTISAASGVSNASGVVTFTVKSSTAGSATFTAVDSTDSVTVTQTAGVTFTPGAASQLLFSTQPSSSSTVQSTLTQQPIVQIKDSNGNVVSSSSATVVLTVASDIGCSTLVGSGTLSGSSVVASSGVATFAGVKYTKIGTYYLKATSAGLTSACSNAITMAASAPAALASCESLAGSGYTVDTSTARLANGALCSANELQFYSRSKGAPDSVCVVVDCGPQAKVCRSISKTNRNIDYYCAHQ